MTAATRWTLIILGLLVGNLIAMALLIVSSIASGAQVIPAYYERAVRFDDEIDDAARAKELGWHADITIDRGGLVVDARDAAGAPIVGARVRVRGFQRARAARRFDLELDAIAAGRYRIERTNERGVHDLEISIDRVEVHFVARRVAEVP